MLAHDEQGAQIYVLYSVNNRKGIVLWPLTDASANPGQRTSIGSTGSKNPQGEGDKGLDQWLHIHKKQARRTPVFHTDYHLACSNPGHSILHQLTPLASGCFFDCLVAPSASSELDSSPLAAVDQGGTCNDTRVFAKKPQYQETSLGVCNGNGNNERSPLNPACNQATLCPCSLSPLMQTMQLAD